MEHFLRDSLTAYYSVKCSFYRANFPFPGSAEVGCTRWVEVKLYLMFGKLELVF